MTPVTNDIVVPASIANLGAGFDVLSVAVRIRVRITDIRPTDTDGGTVFLDGLPREILETAFRHARALGRPTPGIRIGVTSVPRAGTGQRGGGGRGAAAL
jgi:homoserine kinase